MTKHVLYICKSCAFSLRQRDYLGERGGKYLFDRVSDLAEDWLLKSDFAVEELVCLSACKRPCAIALTGANKTSLMFGDLSPVNSAEAISNYAIDTIPAPTESSPAMSDQKSYKRAF